MTITTSSVWFVYLLECLNGKIYTGITTNVEARFNKHLSGKGAKFTKMNPPSHIIATQQCENRSEASWNTRHGKFVLPTKPTTSES